jgi:hypothetical protein
MANPFMKISDKNADVKEKQAQLAQDRFDNMIKKQMDTQTGRSFVFYILEKLLYNQNIADTNASVYGKTAKQAVANDIVKEIKKTCPELILKMEEEAELYQ